VSVTPRRDLRSGVSVWEAGPPRALPSEPLLGDLTVDALVVGAGITGALIADALSDSGLQVAVVDRRRPTSGATTASTALVLNDLDMPLVHLIERMGEDRATRIWHRSRLAVDALRERTQALGIDASCEERDALYLDGNLLDRDGLAREAEARRRVGVPVTLLEPADVERRFGIRGRAALLDAGNLAADPLRLAAGYLQLALSGGARLFSPVNVTDVSPYQHAVAVATTGGPEIRARYVVLATGYEIPKWVPHAGHAIASTWAIATAPQPQRLWPGRCMIWEASDPYLYVRTRPDGRVLCGGEDEDIAHPAARDALLSVKTRVLETRLAGLLPNLDPAADFAWCGTFGVSETGTPSIGAVPGMHNCFAVLGFGGNGTTFSMLAAQILRAHIAGRPDPDSELFAFRRAD
jgi:glycine/D-amino acid oxidase-like deaminating enzyme